MSSFNSCLVSLDLSQKLPLAELRALAADYQKDGMSVGQAMQQVLEDKLQMARMERKNIVEAVRSAWEAKGGKPRPVVREEAKGVRYSVSGDVTEDTIDVDGETRPARNSKGKALAGTKEAIRRFWRWFGNSKMVDEQGRPLVLYHSTLEDKAQFDATGKFMGYTGVSGISVTDNPDMASRYLDRYAEFGWVDGKPNQPFSKNVMAVYVKAENPLYRNEPFKTNIPLGAPLPEGYVSPLVAQGYDALVRDDAISKGGAVKHSDAKNAIRGREIVVFDPTQIKSATGNNGEFSPDNPDIRYSTAETLADVRAAWDAAGIKNFISERNGVISLSQIIVPEAGRGAGAGSRAMQQLVDYADRTGQRITLSPSADFGGSKVRMIPFYKRFGFVENKGRNKDYEVSESMYRDPQGQRASVATMPQARAPLAAISPMIQKLADGGAVVVHADASTLPGGKAPAGVQALTEKDGTIHLVASSLNDANARAVLLHEAFHAGAEKLIGTEQWTKLMARLDGLHKLAKGGKGAARDFYEKAAQRVATAKARGAVASGMELEEFGAYTIEEYESAPPSLQKWVDDLIGLVKAWALARFGLQVGDVTPAQLSGLARLALLDVRAARLRAQPAPAFSSAGKVDSPAFRRWFGNSKAVDPMGAPKVMYHGTYRLALNGYNKEGTIEQIDAFRSDTNGGSGAIYVTDSPDYADQYTNNRNPQNGGQIYPVYVKAERPFEFYNEDHMAQLRGILTERGQFGTEGFRDGRASDYVSASEWRHLENGSFGVLERPLVRGSLKSAGFDSYYVREQDGGWDAETDTPRDVMTLAVFSPEQVKSAIGNTGAFDPNNPDIRYSVAPGPAPRGMPAATWTAPEETRIDAITHVLQDRFIDMKRVVQTIRKTSGDIGDKFDPYLQEELFHGRSATGFKDYLDDELRPLLEDLQMRGVKLADFEQYLHMRHAEEANEQIARINPEMPDGGSGVMTKDARDYLANLPPAKAATYAALAARVDAMVKRTQGLLLAYGLEKQETIDAWNGTYQHYVPLNRADMEDMLQGFGTGQGFSIRGPAAKRRVGSDKGVVNVIASLAQARERAIVRGEKNRLDVALYGLALKAPNPEFWKPVNPKKNPAALQAELLAMGLPAALVQNYIDEPTQKTIVQRSGATPAGQQTIPGAGPRAGEEVVRRVNTMMRNEPNVVAVRINGEDRFLFMNKRNERALRMAATIKNLNSPDLGKFLSMSAVVTRWFAAVNTQYNPIFGAVNLLRDSQAVMLNLTTTPLAGKQAQVAAELGKMLWKSGGKWFRLDKLTGQDAALWDEFQREGGVTGYRAMFANGTERNVELEKELKRMASGKFAKAGRAVIDWISDYNTALENVTRIAVYKVGKDNGLSPAQAASVAKNISTNFNRRGAIGSQVGSLYAFFNAAVQGTARIAQTVDPRTKSGKAIIGGGLLLGTIQAVMLAAAGFEDDEPPEFIQQKNLVIPNPFSEAKDYFTVPMPLGFNVLPTISRIVTQFALSGGKKPAKRVTDLLGAVLDSFNPIGNAGFSIQTVLPTAVDPLAALESNRDYTGKKIYNEDMNPLSPTPGHTRARGGASAPAKLAAEGINWVLGGNDYVPGVWSPTPEHLEYLTGQLTGGVGRELLKGWQTGQALITGEELPVNRIPAAGRFYGTTEDGFNVRSRFMDNLQELNLLKQEYEGRAKDKAGAAEFKKSNPLVGMADQAQAVQRAVSEMNREKRRLLEKGDARDKVKLLDERMRTTMEKFNAKVLERREKLEAAQ